MSEGIETLVTGLGVWAVGVRDAAAWRERALDPEVEAPTGDSLGKRNRRRASTLARALADVFTEAAGQSGADVAVIPAVFGSALGEAQTMIGLLDQMWRLKEEPSPMGFAMSVHNAASGLVSIACKNTGFTTSLAADYDTPAMALLEGAGLCATSGQTVVVACADEAAPVDLVPPDETFGVLAAAVALSPVGSEVPPLARIRGPFKGEATIPGAEMADELARNPQVGLLDLVDAVQQGRRGVLRMDRGRGAGWCLAVEGP